MVSLPTSQLSWRGRRKLLFFEFGALYFVEMVVATKHEVQKHQSRVSMTSAARIIIGLFICLLGWQSAGLVSAQTPAPKAAEPSGYRITLTDNYSFEVDEIWNQGSEVWYRKGSISKGLDSGSVKKITPLSKAAPDVKAAPEVATEKKPSEPPAPFRFSFRIRDVGAAARQATPCGGADATADRAGASAG